MNTLTTNEVNFSFQIIKALAGTATAAIRNIKAFVKMHIEERNKLRAQQNQGIENLLKLSDRKLRKKSLNRQSLQNSHSKFPAAYKVYSRLLLLP
jgi:hypothetical protein